MSKNNTLLLKMFEMGRPGKPLFQFLSPFAEIKCFQIRTHLSLPQMLNNPKIHYQPLKQDFDRILILHSGQASNARRSVFINQRRSHLIDLINKQGSPQKLYVLQLSQINQFIPIHYLVKHLETSFQYCRTRNKHNHTTNNKQKKFSINDPTTLNEILFPEFNPLQWQRFLMQAFQKSNSISHYTLEQSYLNIQIFTLCMMRFAKNPQYLYEDLRDFNTMLHKFNFIRYFWQIAQDNEYEARKYSERLVKSLEWRTHESEEFLLLLIRMQNWERFLISVQDFCLTHEKMKK